MRRKLINLGMVLGEQGIRVLCSLVVMTMCARYLGPVKFGAYSYVIGIATMFIPLAKLGVDGLTLRESARSHTTQKNYLETGIILQIISSIIAAILAILVCMSGSAPQGVSLILALIASVILIATPGDTYYAAMKGREDLKFVTILRSLVFIIVAILVVSAIRLGLELEYFVALRSVEVMLLSLGALVAFSVRVGVIKLIFDGNSARMLLRAALPVVIFGSSTMIYTRIDQYMLGQMTDGKSLGLYSLAVRITEVFGFVAIAIQAASSAAMTRNYDDGNAGAFDQRVFDAFSLGGWACAVVIVIAAPFLVVPIFGAGYAGSIPIALILALGTPLLFQRVALGTILTIQNRLWSSAWIASGGAMVNVALNFMLIPQWGGIGAALATLISLMMAGVLGSLISTKERALGVAMLRSLEPISAAVRIVRHYRPRARTGETI